MVLGTVEHIGSMDKLVPSTTNPQLRLCVAKNDFTPETQSKPTSLILWEIYMYIFFRYFHSETFCKIYFNVAHKLPTASEIHYEGSLELF